MSPACPLAAGLLSDASAATVSEIPSTAQEAAAVAAVALLVTLAASVVASGGCELVACHELEVLLPIPF